MGFAFLDAIAFGAAFIVVALGTLVARRGAAKKKLSWQTTLLIGVWLGGALLLEDNAFEPTGNPHFARIFLACVGAALGRWTAGVANKSCSGSTEATK
ncbi:MAG: hypothetical protein IJ387_14375 [Thermoguttaceae bacterium]|nr:hypothetical protein [Thermoguttaceae bacterium]